MKPKQNYKILEHKAKTKDCCYTPDYAVLPLTYYMPPAWRIWEPAAGDGHIVKCLRVAQYSTIGTDIQYSEDQNFLLPFSEHGLDFDAIITNPPYSIKYKFLSRCYEIGKPFALLMPLESLGAASANRLFAVHGMQMIVFDKRIDFFMPNKGDAGSAHFPTAWFTWGFNLPSDIVYKTIKKDKKIIRNAINTSCAK